MLRGVERRHHRLVRGTPPDVPDTPTEAGLIPHAGRDGRVARSTGHIVVAAAHQAAVAALPLPTDETGGCAVAEAAGLGAVVDDGVETGGLRRAAVVDVVGLEAGASAGVCDGGCWDGGAGGDGCGVGVILIVVVVGVRDGVDDEVDYFLEDFARVFLAGGWASLCGSTVEVGSCKTAGASRITARTGSVAWCDVISCSGSVADDTTLACHGGRFWYKHGNREGYESD